MNRRLSILHLYKTYDPVLGGIEGHVQLLARAQVARGHQVSVLVTAQGAQRVDVEHGVEVIRCRRIAEFRSMPISLGLFSTLRKRSYDVVHLQTPFPLGEIAQAVAGRASASIASYQSDIVRQRLLGALYRPLMVRLLRRHDRILVSSKAYLESSKVLQSLASKRQCSVVPLGIEVERFAAVDPRNVAQLRQRYGPSIVLFVGRLRAYKGLPDLVDAVARVAETTSPKPHLLVAGEGPERSRLDRRIAARGIANRVHLLGDVDAAELPALYAAADIVVLPSRLRSEAYGLVLVEAMAAGTPVISTELDTGTSWINRDGDTGLVVDPGAPEQLSQAIAKLLSEPETARRMGRSGRQRAREKFGHQRMVDRIMSIYREVLGARAGR